MSAGEGEVEEEAGGAALLAEAAGYLSTLGANLRARADALREKRLGRRAPTNALGLRRVVDKLLLICELSRRSLDNVEAGVGRVLRACQRRADPPRARHRTELRRVGRHILKVPAHISLEHYRSCRVRAAQLPQGDCDFYPVYFDCAALRARRTQPNSKKNAEKCEEIENIERRTTARPNPPVDGRDSTDMFVSVDTDQNKKIYNSEDSMSDSRPQNTNDSNDAKKATKRSNRKDSNISQKSKLYEDDNDNSNENQKNKTEKSESKKIYTSEDSMSASRPQNTKEKSEKFKHICEHSISDPKSKRDADNSEINNGDSGVKEMNSKLINNNDNTEKSKHEGEHSESSLINKATVKDLNIAQLRKDNKDSDGTEAALKSHTNSEKSKYATSHLKDKENDNNSNVTFSERDNNELDEIALADKAKIENIDNTCQSKNNIEVVETKEKSKKHNRDNKKSRHRRKSVFISDKEQSSDENTGPNNDTGSSENYPQKNSKILNSQHISADCSDERIIEKKYDGHESKQKERKSDKSHGPKSKRRLNQILSSDEEGQIKNRSEKESENREDPEVNESIDTIIEATEETIKGQSTKNSSTFDPAKFNDQTKGDSDSSKSEKVDTEKSNKAKSSNLNKENNSNESPKSIMSESDEDNLTSIKSPSKDSHGETDVKSDDFEKERQMNKIPDNNINPNSGQKGEESPTFTPTFTPTKVHDDNSQSQDGSESSNKPMIKCVDLSKLLRTPENAMNMLKSPQKCDDLLVESHSAARACEESKYAQKIRMKEKRAKERDKATHNKEKVTKKEVTTIIDLDTTDDDESVPISKRILTRKKRVKYKNLTSSDLSDEDLKQKNKGKPGSRTRKNDNSSSRKITVKQAKDLVATFKPKKFDIQVGKMPTFSNKFLEKHSLSLISQNGSIIAKLTQDSVVINAKTDLLSDSSDSVKSKDHRKRKNSSDAKSPKAKRRHLMESARAKRLLLTYSSSDTEDDLVKEALNEIAEAVKDLGPNEKENKKAQDTLKQKPIEIEKKKAQDSEKQKLLCSSSSSLSDEDKINNALKELEDEIKVGKQNIGNGSGSEDNKFESEEQMSGIKEKNSRRERSKSSSIEKTRERRENKSKSEKEISASEGSKENKSGRGDQRSVSEEKTLESEEIMSGDEKVRSGSEEDRLGSKDKRSGSIERSKSVQNSDKSEEEAPRKKLKRTASEEIKPDDKRSDSKTSSISQVDGNYDETSSGSEMGRTTRSQASNSSDSREDKAIESLTNLKSLHSKHRQRDSPSSSDDSNASKKHKSNAAKAKSIRDDNLLELDSKSSSEVDSDGPVEIPDMAEQNGDPVIGEVARDDLLNDTDSDSTQRTGKDETEDTNSKSNGKTKGDKKSKGKGKSDKKKVLELDSSENEESDNDDLKVRRRKAVTISSDSEAGSSKKKKNKDSDYEHSKSEDSDDSAAHFKKTKRKGKKSSDSEGSMSRSSDGGKSKKKRRRIKQVDSEGSDGSGSENEGKKSGRKNIRKVMGKDQLEEATKKAAREERERVARITERQKLYNNTAFDESGKPDEVILEKVVLDFDPDTKKPLIQVDKGIVKKLKPHQANGIKFMWDACFESVKQIKKGRGSGCILAHCMGLGKTLQVVSLTHTLLAHEELTGVRRVLVVCPLSTVLNWVNEFRMWLEFAEDDHDIQIYELSRYKQNTERAYQLREWLESGGVCVLGYEMFRNLSADNPKKFRKKLMAAFQESLVDPGPDLVVCDEGHLLKNEKTSLSQSMNRIRTLRRIVLTGTPLQNNLKEYYCMVQFVKPNLLGKYNEYLNRFVNPITNGQYTDSTEHDIRIMKRRSHVLHKMLDGAVQRRDYGVLAPFLPPKHEYVLFITLTEIQVKLYQHYMDNYSRRQQAGKTTGFLFQDFQSLQRIWTHPLVLKANSERYEIAQQKKRDREEEEEDTEGSLVDFLDDDSTAAESTTEDDSDVLSDVSDDSRKKSKKKSPKKSKVKAEATSSSAASARRTRANPGDKVDEIDFKDLKDPVDVRMENPTEWWIKMVEEKELEDMRNSNKLMLLFDILRQCEAIGDKLLVFSQSLYSLDLIEHFLSKIDEATQMGKVEESLAGHVGSWSPGIDYFRLDGSTSCENRSIWCKNFNKEDNPRARLFLISTRAGGLGINLVAANRVVIFDVSWNPSHDVQSIFRVYRFGQKKPCYVYRFLAMGTMEEKIYERQVTKQAISKRVIDEQQIDRHYAENDLAELYTFQPEPEQPRPVPLLPKDRLFAEMLKEHEKLIYRYHEHDSLLENKEEETLTEEERKAAWEDFENEKNRPPPVPFNNTPFLPQMNGMGNMMAQQQQLMMATMLNVIRKDYPGLSEQQIANILPQILYGEPLFGGYDFGMMQKMRAMTGMGSNLMMNPAAAAAGGTSALAFQPTWQQQQQMQLQRIQQQQQALNSGVKYYSGGLGSRDPLSMALQQKQQREMMLNNTGDRLRDMLVGSASREPGVRGRPPQLPPPAHSGEVVNLDDSE